MNNQRSSELDIHQQVPWFQSKVLWLWGIYALIVATIILRVNVESTQYVTPDSEYYLIVAENLAAGKGYVSPHPMDYPIKAGAKEYPFTIWPIGYPTAIFGMMKLTGLDALWASKVVNLTFLGLIFIMLWLWFKECAWFVSLYFLSYGRMEVFSYSWSEVGFLFLLLLLCHWIVNSLKSDTDKWLWLKLTIALGGLFLFRYASLILFFFCAGWMILFFGRKKYRLVVHYFSALFISSAFALSYLYRNYQLSGFYSGMDRIQPEIEEVAQFAWLLLRGLFNELMLARNYFFKGNVDPLFIGLMLIQLLVIFQLFRHRHLIKAGILRHTNLLVLTICSLTYLVGIIVLRKIQPFDPFDFRILAPFSMPLFITLFAVVTLPENRAFYSKTSLWIIGFMAICWVMNLPKQFLVDLIVK